MPNYRRDGFMATVSSFQPDLGLSIHIFLNLALAKDDTFVKRGGKLQISRRKNSRLKKIHQLGWIFRKDLKIASVVFLIF